VIQTKQDFRSGAPLALLLILTASFSAVSLGLDVTSEMAGDSLCGGIELAAAGNSRQV
jgi:hypothetical protein